MKKDLLISTSLIAPCGMNCALCLGYLREKNRCLGCNSNFANKPKMCVSCIIKNCENLQKTKTKLCYECEKYPCKRLKQLDTRYKTKYNMSMTQNLTDIKANGMESFLKEQAEKWTCKTCGGNICVHRGFCLTCKKNKG